MQTVETTQVNEAVKNNSDKFPQSYIKNEKSEVIENFDNLVKRFDAKRFKGKIKWNEDPVQYQKRIMELTTKNLQICSQKF